MRVARILGLCAVFCLASFPARADWEYTHWAQTPKQLMLASNGNVSRNKLKQHSPHAGELGSPTALSAPLYAQYKIADFQFVVYFSFEEKEGTLNLIELALLDHKKCPELKEFVFTQFGVPLSEKDMNGLTSYSWRDQENRNIVTFSHMFNCYIRYTPIPIANAAN
jgi:hypothetical protein